MPENRRKWIIRLNIAVAAVMLVVVVGFMFPGIFRESRYFPMQGLNIADLNPDEIIRNIGRVTRTEEIYTMETTWHMTGDFEWDIIETFSVLTFRDTLFGTTCGHARQLTVSPAREQFYVTASRRLSYEPKVYVRLIDVLYGLRYIPQDYIRNLVYGYPCNYIISFSRHVMIPPFERPVVFYNRNGVVDGDVIQDRFIRFDIMPIYQGRGIGEDLIHIFFEKD